MVPLEQASIPDLPSPATPTGHCPGLTGVETRQPWQQQPHQEGGLREPETPPPPSSSEEDDICSDSSPLILKARRLAVRPRATAVVLLDDSPEEEWGRRRDPYEIVDGSGVCVCGAPSIFQQQKVLLLLGHGSCLGAIII
jgi:hypothetical protein